MIFYILRNAKFVNVLGAIGRENESEAPRYRCHGVTTTKTTTTTTTTTARQQPV